MTDTPHISPEDLALLALGALSPEEAAAYQAHIDACEKCRHELAELRGDISLLALSAPPKPLPAAARERFLASIGAAQNANQASTTNQAAAPAPATASSSVSSSTSASVVTMPPRPASTSGAIRLWQAIAAVLLIALGFHAYKVHQLQEHLSARNGQLAALRENNEALTTANAKARAVLQALTASSAQHVLLTATHATAEPQGNLTYIAESGSLIFSASHLKPIPADKTYELWIIPANGAAPIPAGLFHPDLAGNGSVVLPNIPQGVTAKAFGVTEEAAAGATTPTMPILISGAAS